MCRLHWKLLGGGPLIENIRVFGFLAVFTSCMGLLGLAVYTAERRTKEIGIRKVLGAGVTQIVALLNHETITPPSATIPAFPSSLYRYFLPLLSGHERRVFGIEQLSG